MMTDPYGQTNPRSLTGAPGVATPPRIPPVGHFTPRMLLALAAIYNPTILVGYLLYTYGPSNSCVLGGLCNFGSLPSLFQVFLLIVGEGTLGALLFVPLWWLLSESRPARDAISRTARNMMRFVTIRPLMVSYSLVLMLLLIVGVVIHRIPAPLFLLGLASAVICLWCAAGSEFTPTPPLPPPQTRQPLQRNRDTSGSAFLNDSPPPQL